MTLFDSLKKKFRDNNKEGDKIQKEEKMTDEEFVDRVGKASTEELEQRSQELYLIMKESDLSQETFNALRKSRRVVAELLKRP
ncbi:MAG: hypothetical protein GXP45_05880 [bacterium]|nr:hypothetical protein [bacterium]